MGIFSDARKGLALARRALRSRAAVREVRFALAQQGPVTPGRYPVAVYFADGEVLRFQYRVVQLNRLPWRKFIKKANPVASALMAKMKIAVRDRPLVKLECLRLMLTLRLDPARMRLNEREDQRFVKKLEQTRWKPKEKEAIVEYVTSWEERGITKGLKKGLEKGRMEGRVEGRVEALREILLDVLVTRFKTVDANVVARIQQMNSSSDLKDLAHRALTANSLRELGLDQPLT